MYYTNSKANGGGKALATNGALMVDMWNLHCLADLDIILWSDPLENFCFVPFLIIDRWGHNKLDQGVANLIRGIHLIGRG